METFENTVYGILWGVFLRPFQLHARFPRVLSKTKRYSRRSKTEMTLFDVRVPTLLTRVSLLKRRNKRVYN